jgi:hypothetical protein
MDSDYSCFEDIKIVHDGLKTVGQEESYVERKGHFKKTSKRSKRYE